MRLMLPRILVVSLKLAKLAAAHLGQSPSKFPKRFLWALSQMDTGGGGGVGCPKDLASRPSGRARSAASLDVWKKRLQDDLLSVTTKSPPPPTKELPRCDLPPHIF